MQFTLVSMLALASVAIAYPQFVPTGTAGTGPTSTGTSYPTGTAWASGPWPTGSWPTGTAWPTGSSPTGLSAAVQEREVKEWSWPALALKGVLF